MKRVCIVLSILAGCLALLFVIHTRAGTIHFVENFTTTDYRDSGGTSAWWDTGSGKLKLYPLNLQEVGTYISPGSALGVAVDGD
ncbi:MAG: hypothetical protein P8181_06025, partial [bacterium]